MGVTDDWRAYEKLVLDKLDTHGQTLVALHGEIVRCQIETSVLKTKVTVIGTLAGGGAGIGVAIINFIISLVGRV